MTGLCHEFDSSLTCNYCGIAAERVPGIAEQQPCPARKALCTRCQKPLGNYAKKVDGKLYHEDCWKEPLFTVSKESTGGVWFVLRPAEPQRTGPYPTREAAEQAAKELNEREQLKRQAPRLRADRDRLLAAAKAGLRYMACPHIIPADDCERCVLWRETHEAIRLAEEE